MELQSQQLLASPPYNDDFDRTKNFHRVLFRPGTAVQARELTQLQTILQEQVSRLGDHIFKDGSIVKGCSLSFVDDISLIRLANFFEDSNDNTLTVDDSSLVGAILVGETSGVQATVLLGRTGFEATDTPNRFFVRYTMPGFNGEQTFTAGERINVHGDEDSYVEQFVLTVPSTTDFIVGDFVTFGTAPTVTARARILSKTSTELTLSQCSIRPTAGTYVFMAADPTKAALISNVKLNLAARTTWIRAVAANHTGVSYGVSVSEGIIFHKGHFVRVAPHFTIVDEESRTPVSKVLGFVTEESIVTEDIDQSLYDNAAGFTNFNAPGAHRLRLVSTIVARDRADLSSEDQFFPIAEFSDAGVVFERTDPEYARLGDELARRTYEESGDYTIIPHGVTSNTYNLNSADVEYTIGAGLSYVRGRRVDIKNPLKAVGRRGTDTLSYEDQIVTMTYGNYVVVREFRGYFPSDTSPEVLFYSSPQTSITSNRPHTTAPTGTIIGRANVRNVVFDPTGGPKGSPTGRYRMYLFNIRMESGNNFDAVRSVVYSAGGTHAAADVELSAGAATLVESSYNQMLFSIGAKAVRDLRDGAGNQDTAFYYTAANTGVSSLQSDGTLTFQVPNGGGILGFTDASDASETRIDVVLSGTANVYTTALSGTVNAVASTNTIIGTNLNNLFFPGEYIRVGSVDARVVSVANTTHMTVSPAIADVTNASYQRMHVAGSVITLEGSLRTITVTGSNQVTVNMGTTYATGVPAAASVRFYARKTNALPIAKELRRGTVVRINTATNEAGAAGPWCLGVPDVLRITGVYKGSNTTTFDTGVNYASRVQLDSGQEDSHYDFATVTPNSGDDAVFANTTVLIQFDHFVANNQLGQGFFSVESYPVDDSVAANSNTTIRTADIPTYTNNTRSYDLRDVVDFRPYKTASANVTTSIASSTLNPTWTNTFEGATTAFNPFPNQNFECNFTHYLGRYDVVALTPQGQVVIKEGQSSLRPKLPEFPAEAMAIATVEVPPYPSLADNERTTSSAGKDLRITTLTQKRYTMRDISVIERRVDRLEYYATLSALEQSAASMTIPDAAGLDRFKNGIFADPLNSHVHGRVSDPQYAIAVDAQKGHARPRTFAEYFNVVLAPTQSANIRRTGSIVSLNYTDEVLIDQPFATTLRQPSSSTFQWVGSLDVSPRRWQEVETQSVPQITSSDYKDLVYQEMAQPALGSQFGWWRDSLRVDTSSDDLVPRVSNATVAVGNDVRSTAQSIYIRPREVTFRAVNLKPFTSVRVFIDDVDVTADAAPASGTLANASRTSPWGSELKTNSRGEVLGKLRIPANTFKTGRRLLTISDANTGNETTFASSYMIVDLYYDYYVPQPPPLPPPAPVLPPIRPKPAPEPSPTPRPPLGKIVVEVDVNASYTGNNVWNVIASANAYWTVNPSTPLSAGDTPSNWECRITGVDGVLYGPGPWNVNVTSTDAQGVFTASVGVSTGDMNNQGFGSDSVTWTRPVPVSVDAPTIPSLPVKPTTPPVITLPPWGLHPPLLPDPIPDPVVITVPPANPTINITTERATREWMSIASEPTTQPLVGGATDNAPITATIVATHPDTNNIVVTVTALDTVAPTTSLVITPQTDTRVVIVNYDVTNRSSGSWSAASNRLQVTATATLPGAVVVQSTQVLDLSIAPRVAIPPSGDAGGGSRYNRYWQDVMPRFREF